MGWVLTGCLISSMLMGKLLEKKKDCPCADAALTSFYAIWDLPWAAPGPYVRHTTIIPLILKRDLRDLECDRPQPAIKIKIRTVAYICRDRSGCIGQRICGTSANEFA
jgi:hypothetical protein